MKLFQNILNLQSRIHSFFVICLLGLSFLAAPASYANKKDDALKTSLLFQFAKYIDWENKIGGSFDICILGGDVDAAEMSKYSGKQISGENVNMRSVQSPDNTESCEIVFISSEQTAGLDVAEIFKARSVLTVGEVDDFIDKGGMINFIRKGTRVKFEIARGPMESAGLRPKVALLKAALRIR